MNRGRHDVCGVSGELSDGDAIRGTTVVSSVLVDLLLNLVLEVHFFFKFSIFVHSPNSTNKPASFPKNLVLESLFFLGNDAGLLGE